MAKKGITKMKFDNMSHNERVYYLFKPILKALQDTGGQFSRSDIEKMIYYECFCYSVKTFLAY